MGIFNFPSNFVYWEEVNNHDMIKPILLEKIKRLEEQYHDNNPGLIKASTSYAKSKNIVDTCMYKDLIWNPLDNAIREHNSDLNKPNIIFNDSILDESWYTLYKEGGSFNYHNHDDKLAKNINGKYYYPSFSVIYILKDENKHNATTFTEHSPYSSSVHPFHYQHSFDTSKNKDIKEGCVLIFPSSLYHCVNQVTIPGRITIAMNICSSYQ